MWPSVLIPVSGYITHILTSTKRKIKQVLGIINSTDSLHIVLLTLAKNTHNATSTSHDILSLSYSILLLLKLYHTPCKFSKVKNVLVFLLKQVCDYSISVPGGEISLALLG